MAPNIVERLMKILREVSHNDGSWRPGLKRDMDDLEQLMLGAATEDSLRERDEREQQEYLAKRSPTEKAVDDFWDGMRRARSESISKSI